MRAKCYNVHNVTTIRAIFRNVTKGKFLNFALIIATMCGRITHCVIFEVERSTTTNLRVGQAYHVTQN